MERKSCEYRHDNGSCKEYKRKIEMNPKNPKYLKVVWGVGYKIEKQ